MTASPNKVSPKTLLHVAALTLGTGAWSMGAMAQPVPLDGSAPATQPPGQSLTEQLLDPNQTPLARSEGPRSLLPPSGAALPGPQDGSLPPELAAPEVFGDSTPDVFFPSGERVVVPPVQRSQSLAARPGEEGTGIEVSRLSSVADEGIGLIGPVEGGLSPMLWAGSRRLTVEDGLAALTPPPPSAAIGNLFRRLLISRGDLPQGASGGRSILGLRLAALYGAGFGMDVDRLAGLVPAGDLAAQTATPAARAALSLDLTDKACGYLTRLPTEGDAGNSYARFALELGALCQARAGMDVAALLSVDLVREYEVGDTAFVALATRAAGGPALDVPDDEIFTSLHLALAREAGVSLEEGIVARVEPALLTTLANDKSLAWEDRLDAAEAAAARSLLSARDLAEIYRQAIVAGAGDSNPRVSAFAVSLDAPDQTTRLGAIASAFDETPVELWPATLPAFAGSLRAIAPTMAHADNSVFMTEALALLGDAARADGWIGIATTTAPGEVARLETLVRIATPAQSSFVLPWNPDVALRSIEVRLEEDDREAKWLTAFEMQALASLGVPVPQVVWAQFDDAEMPGVQLDEQSLRALRVAAQDRRAGEAALATLTALSSIESDGALAQTRLADLTPGSLAAIITALVRSGLEEDARRIAVEALIVRAHGEG
ncbi:hypothetical protein [Pyruvatibacter sp.]